MIHTNLGQRLRVPIQTALVTARHAMPSLPACKQTSINVSEFISVEAAAIFQSKKGFENPYQVLGFLNLIIS